MDTSKRKKIKCPKCKEEKFCYYVEIQISVFKDPALATRIEDWCCLGCIYDLAKEIKKFNRIPLHPERIVEKLEKEMK